MDLNSGTIFQTNLGSETFMPVSCDVAMLMLLKIRQTLTKKSGTAAPLGDIERVKHRVVWFAVHGGLCAAGKEGP